MKILCCGIFPALQRTLELKTLKTGAVNRVRSVTQSVGGKATNAARVLKTLGADPLLFGFTGGDTGSTIKKLLDNEGIGHVFVETSVPTRTAQTLLTDDAPDF
nr:1-phosphofructokinase [Kiritimatiellota bacterium]